MHPPIISLFKRSTTAEIIEIIKIMFLEPRKTYYLKGTDRLEMVVELSAVL